jgi:LmbE family N-acetylglucosaminyl deacetylase
MRDSVGSKTHDGLSILAIGAHPDDIELGCGGSLAKLAAAGARVQTVIFSKGRRGTLLAADRERESTAALTALGIRDIAIYDFEDTKLTYSLNEMIDTLDEHVRSFKPDRVYTMFQHDRHQDHRAVYEASAVSCRNILQLLGYETPSSYPNFTPTVFEQIGEHVKTKVRALNCHKSQGERLYMQEESVRSAASFRGVQVQLGPCEGFIPYKMIL